jgi:2-keto-4-pentenoate hydratase/2-oxohepta-3-ene-1,7-dioic acid hydratase in catechol pathway
MVQSGNTSDMIFNFSEIIEYISKYMTLKIGDLIYTGTPAGVGKIDIGNELTGFLSGKQMINMKVK